MNLAEHTSWIPAPNVENAAEFHAGMLLAQKVENAVVISVAEKCTWSLMDAMSSANTTRTRLSREHVVGQPVECDHCHKLVKSGAYWSKSSLTLTYCHNMY